MSNSKKKIKICDLVTFDHSYLDVPVELVLKVELSKYLNRHCICMKSISIRVKTQVRKGTLPLDKPESVMGSFSRPLNMRDKASTPN